jgi:hypothetical protein
MESDTVVYDPSPGTALVEALDIATEIDVRGMHAAMAAMREFVAGELRENVHYGKVPGVPKNFLWLPGAEQIMRGFNCRPEYVTVQQIIDPNTPYFMFWRKCRMINIATGKVVGEADAMCTYDEFVDRNGNPLDFSKSLPNGLMKADKRSMVKAARTLGCTSEFFTQDEDLVQQLAQGQNTGTSLATGSLPKETNNWAPRYAEKDANGQWWMNCPQHGISKAKHWPANNRGPENVACTRKTGNDWCNVRVTMPQLRAMQAAAMVSPATVEPPEASEETYDLPYDD